MHLKQPVCIISLSIHSSFTHHSLIPIVTPYTRAYPSLDIAQLVIQRNTLRIQYNLYEFLTAPSEALYGDESFEDNRILINKLNHSVLSANELYSIIDRKQLDSLALKLLQNEKCSDEQLVRYHWNRLLSRIVNGTSANK